MHICVCVCVCGLSHIMMCSSVWMNLSLHVSVSTHAKMTWAIFASAAELWDENSLGMKIAWGYRQELLECALSEAA